MMLGLDPERDERALANEWFLSIEEPTERRRIAILLLQMLETGEPGQARSWADKEPDGGVRAPNMYNVFGMSNGR